MKVFSVVEFAQSSFGSESDKTLKLKSKLLVNKLKMKTVLVISAIFIVFAMLEASLQEIKVDTMHLIANEIQNIDKFREGRSSPVGSIAGYITSQQIKRLLKKQKQKKNKAQRRYSKPIRRISKPSVYYKPRRCFNGHTFNIC